MYTLAASLHLQLDDLTKSLTHDCSVNSLGLPRTILRWPSSSCSTRTSHLSVDERVRAALDDAEA
ncbi:hypothetical protein EXIGLDRAFT_716270 [Exidia glandulosa HHB12029]|uniref:Uncharacterized protein n=1 Tax=Exidia glandulosa HHB12029 TaxID=1314781 RepID=A0A165QZR1_EXIGL|nr:hypothetical protein EXIGLDRAFT_716270 [Exidia glandulosa HHB12029]